MKRSDLFRELVRVFDMCKGTGVDPIECVRMDGVISNTLEELVYGFLSGYYTIGYYTFAVAILEGKPLFVGDEAYWKSTGDKFDWDKGELCHADYYQNLTRTPPARTIEGRFCLYVAGFGDRKYYFKNHDDLIKVESAINKLLRGE